MLSENTNYPSAVSLSLFLYSYLSIYQILSQFNASMQETSSGSSAVHPIMKRNITFLTNAYTHNQRGACFTTGFHTLTHCSLTAKQTVRSAGYPETQSSRQKMTVRYHAHTSINTHKDTENINPEVLQLQLNFKIRFKKSQRAESNPDGIMVLSKMWHNFFSISLLNGSKRTFQKVHCKQLRLHATKLKA